MLVQNPIFITSIQRYRDGVKCFGGTGTVVIETSEGELICNGDTIINNGIPYLDMDDPNLANHLAFRVKRYLERLEYEMGTCKNVIKDFETSKK